MSWQHAPSSRLGVNIDHVATVRNARGGRHPDPVRAAEIAIAAGADGITAHLREDRRHIVDDDIAPAQGSASPSRSISKWRRRRKWSAIALRLAPHAACIVPERRAGAHDRGRARRRRPARVACGRGRRTRRGRHPGFAVHCAEPAQIEAPSRLGAPVIEIHTGAWCEALAGAERAAARPNSSASRAARDGSRATGPRSPCRPRPRLSSPRRRSPRCREIVELNIGHFLIGEAIVRRPRRGRAHDARSMDRGARPDATGRKARSS